MVVDLNVKIGNVLRTEIPYESRQNFIERPNVSLSLRPDIVITHSQESPPPVLRRSRRIRARNNQQNENINIDGNRDPLQGGPERIGATQRPGNRIEGHGLLPNPLSQQTD